MNATPCQVIAIEALTPVVSKVILNPLQPVQYLAGQYLQICVTPEDKRPFSIASIPEQNYLELHIGTPAGDKWSSSALQHLQDALASQQAVQVEVGLGKAGLRAQSARPLILMAGGTGFSYIYGIAQALAAAQSAKPVFLYWGVRHEDALYYQQELAHWAASQPQYHLITVVQEPKSDWRGRTGLVHEAVLADFANLSEYDIYMAGPFAMAGVAREAFLKQGAIREHLFADAFAYI